ncbi:uncharacterized protein BCR38DRAFT_136508 [Pseudomassariella vexata]|uniref:Uncharacterized protein n=1 Tax=Pseudomassariella vexata TaxID=1141098 RepID=A0A1Y2EAT1_9PEZI|nr:uncharacterized protein BCR38DRAFT_136508 [Pseudomassariella vexata]ORY68679.1 hypothetical protein BCR38DRAFT_136508 [Pseudomassariella vexata]
MTMVKFCRQLIWRSCRKRAYWPLLRPHPVGRLDQQLRGHGARICRSAGPWYVTEVLGSEDRIYAFSRHPLSHAYGGGIPDYTRINFKCTKKCRFGCSRTLASEHFRPSSTAQSVLTKTFHPGWIDWIRALFSTMFTNIPTIYTRQAAGYMILSRSFLGNRFLLQASW